MRAIAAQAADGRAAGAAQGSPHRLHHPFDPLVHRFHLLSWFVQGLSLRRMVRRTMRKYQRHRRPGILRRCEETLTRLCDFSHAKPWILVH
jgi:hypothetical protein